MVILFLLFVLAQLLYPVTTFLFTLRNVPYAPQIKKKLIFLKKFTTDNQASISLDPFGFSVKNLQTGRDLMRCNSQGELYSISNINTPLTQPKSIVVISSSLRHN